MSNPETSSKEVQPSGKEQSSKKMDTGVLAAIVTGIFTIVTAIITTIVAPIISKSPTATSPTSSSLVGSWEGSPDCTVVFNKDDGKNVEGSCDNASVIHKFTGTYNDSNAISIIVTRTDPNGCTTNASGHIKIISRDSMEFGYSGWDGCGVKTPSGKQILSRQ